MEKTSLEQYRQTKESYEKRNKMLLQNLSFSLRAFVIRWITFRQVKSELTKNISGNCNEAKILDIGCRRGDKSNAIIEMFSEVFGTSPLLIGGDLTIPESRQNNFIPLEMMAENLPFSDNSFEAVTAFAVHHHFPDLEKAFLEMRRVLKPEGILVLIDTHRLEGSLLRDIVSNIAAKIYEKIDCEGGFFNDMTEQHVKASLEFINMKQINDFWSFPFLRVFISKKT